LSRNERLKHTDRSRSLAIFDVEAHTFMYNNKQKQAMSLFGEPSGFAPSTILRSKLMITSF
jgi:hypothetical protein